MKTIKHYQTFSWKFTLAVLSFCIMQLISNGQSVQSRFWYTGDNIIDMSSYTTPVITPTNVSPSQFVSNGAYWTNGSLSQTEFFVSDNTIYQYDISFGSFVSSVMYDIVTTGPNETFVSSEIGIVPKPGSECDKYYIIYSVGRAQGNTNAGAYSHTGLYFVEYGTDLQNNGGILTPQTQLGTDCYLKTVGNCTDLFTASFAIGPRLANGERFLYAIMISPNSTCNSINTRLYKFRITSSGFVQEDLTPSIANDFIEFSGKISPSETELSPDRSYLAFARQDISSTNPPQTGLDLVVVKLDPATGNLLNSNIANVAYYDLPNEGMGIYSGLEFSSNSQNLFFNNRGLGIRSLTLATGSISSIVSGSNLYSNSHLEMRYYGSGSNDRRICAVKPPSLNSGNFEIGYINTNLNLMAQNSGLNNFIYSQFQTFQNLNGIYTLQDQVDGEDYATWSSPSNSVACCVRYFKGTFDSEAPFSVPTGSATWQPNFNPFNNAPSEVVLEKDLVIPSGSYITIKNMTFRFHPNVRVVIQPNARLYLENATLTALDCDLTWKGVRVLGNPGQAHLVPNQGYLNMTVNTTISHAQCGAAAYDLESGNFLQAGGIIQTNSANFINNLNDLDIRAYTIASNSFFDLNTFKIDNNFRFSLANQPRASLNNVTGVKFRGCTFANDNTTTNSPAFSSMSGVQLIDANALIELKNSTGNTFRNLYHGVLALRFSVNRSFTLKNSTFNGNYIGVYSGGVDFF